MKTRSWDDEDVVSNSKIDFKERKLDLTVGVVDVIRIMTAPVEFKSLYINEINKYIVPKDEDSTILEDNGYEPKRTWACLVIHVARIKGTGGKKKIEKIGMTKAWLFADARKFEAVREINNEYGDVRKLELKITVTDKWKNIGTMLPIMNKSKQMTTSDMIQDYKENKDLLDNFLNPKTDKEIEDILNNDDAEIDLGDDETPKKVKKSTKNKKDEDLDDDLDSLDEDGVEVEESPKKTKKKVSKNKDEDLELDDEFDGNDDIDDLLGDD